MDLLKSIWLILRHNDLHKIVTTRLNIGGTNLLQGLGIKDKTGVQHVFLCWTGIALQHQIEALHGVIRFRVINQIS